MGKRIGKTNGPISPWKARVTAQRRKEAEERNALYRALTPQQRLDKLDKYGHQATKERAKIQSLIDNAKEEKKTSKK